MYREPFDAICRLIRDGNLLLRSRLTVEESLMIFLKVISQAETNRVVQDRFNHFGETISRHFRRVLRAMCIFAKDVILPPKYNTILVEIRSNPKYWPWFKDCVGAIDRTHIVAVVPASLQQIYMGRKSICMQNVMAACSFDMLFTYVYTGWEGTTADSRVLQHAFHDPANAFPRPPEGKYYVVDSSYSSMPRFLAPYRGKRHHLASYRNSG